MPSSIPPSAISARALDHLTGWLRVAYGSDLSQPHVEALVVMLDTMVNLLMDPKARGRIAIPLPAGAAKSLGIISLLTALNELRPQHPLGGDYSVTVAASHVENLAALIRDLQSFGGVPEDRIGLLHEKLYSVDKVEAAIAGDAPAYASLAKTENNDARPYLFCTHARLETGSDRKRQRRSALLTSFQGRPRDLVLWDEGLIASDTWSISRSDVRSYIGGLPYRLEEDKGSEDARLIRRQALAYLQACLPYLDLPEDQSQRFVHLPEPAELFGADIAVSLDAMADALSQLSCPDAVVQFLHTAWKPLRIYRGNGHAADAPSYLTFDVGVPRELDRMIITDAGYPIRLLEHLDSSITLPLDADGQPHPAFSDANLAKIKSHEDVEVVIVKHGGGRRGITKAMSGPAWQRKQAGKLSGIIAEIIRTIPKTEKILVVTFKTRQRGHYTVDIVGTLSRDLTALGINVGKRITFLTWGNHTSLNRFRDYRYGILAGVLQRGKSDLLSSILGQQGDISSDASDGEIRNVTLSEATHDAYQAINRTACRKIRLGPDGLGRAYPAKWWTIYQDPKTLARELKRIMPGLVCKEPRSQGAAFPVAATVARYLDAQPEAITEVSSRVVKKNARGDDGVIGCLLNVPHTTFVVGVKKLPDFTSAWAIKTDGRGYVRRR